MTSERPAKRRRTTAGGIGAPSEADLPSAQVNAPSSSAYATRRVVAADNMPSLTSLCIEVFASHFHAFSADDKVWQPNRLWNSARERLKSVPDYTLSRILAALKVTHSELLSADLIRDSFLRGNTLKLSNDLGGGINKSVVASVPLMGSSLVELALLGFDRIEDTGFERVLSKLPSLQILNLRGCSRVSFKTIDSVTKNCAALHSLNLNYTGVLPVQLATFLHARRDTLRVLKVAIISWTDALFAKLCSELDMDVFRMPALQTLKLRQTALSNVSLNAILPCCPNIRRLDLSFTRVEGFSPRSLEAMGGLEKLSLTSTDIGRLNLVKILQRTQNLQILNIGAIGGGHGQAVGMGNASALTLTDDALLAITKALGPHVTILNLVGNSKIGQRRQPIVDFLESIRHRVKNLNLTGLTSLKSIDLAAFEETDRGPGAPNLEVLSLSKTNIDDAAAPYIAACQRLRVLEVAATRITSEGLYSIIDACPQLSQLDLTKCRGVPLTARRSIFQEWEKVHGGAKSDA